ncbi:MAG: hypothetical protein IIW87_04730 [Alistipes sp.]|nr:hypothetical protein [Alistipes sp.]
MKFNLSYIVLCVLLLSLSLFCACSTDDTNYAADGGEPVLLTFSVDVKSSSVTRADDHTWGDNSDDDSTNNYPEDTIGDSLEERIDLSSLHIMAYHGSDFSFARDIDILAVTEVDGKVTFTCALPKSMPYEAGKSYRFMVIANCTTKNYGISYENNEPALHKLVYSADIQNTIPMWGLKTYTFPEQVPADNVLDLGSISMLRAAAKIGVKLSPEVKAEEYKLKEIKLNYANANGYCVPYGWNHATTYYTEDLAHSQAFRATSTSGDGVLATGINAMARGDETNGYYIYVPETRNNDTNYTPSGEDTTSQLALAVTLTDGKGDDVEFTYEDGIKFCNYNEGKPVGDAFDIVRNHFYDYTITAVNVGLKLNLNVADWEAEDVWELDFSAPIHTKLLVAPNDGAAQPGDEPTVAYSNINDELGAFCGYFKMISPAGASWKPTLTNASAGDYEVRVYTNGETNPDEYDIPVTDSAIEANKDRFFKIVVVAKNPNEVGKVVKLGISYTASWNDDNTLLMINGDSNDHLYYPWFDNDPDDAKDDPNVHWISIKQVSSK